MRPDWLNNMPSAWASVPFGSIFTQSKRKNSRLERDFVLSVMKDRGVIPYTEKGNVGNKVSDDLSGYKLVDKGDFVLNSMNLYMGSVGVSEYDGVTSTAYIVCKPSENVYAGYYNYLIQFKGFQEYVGLLGKGIMEIREAVRWTALKSVFVPLPDFATQRQIADFLDRETARIDLLIEKKQRLVALLGERLAHLVRDLITRGIAAKPELVPSDLFWCPYLPKNWQVRKGFHIGRLVGSSSGEEAEDDTEESVRYIKVGDLNACDGARLESTKAMFRPQSAFQPQSKDFLVFPKRGAAIYTNKVAIAPKNSALDPNLMGWVIFDCHEPEYFMWVLKTRTLDNLADVSTVPQINNKHIYPERFPVPPKEEQTEIVNEIRRVRSLSAAITERNQASIDRLKEYRSALITAAVTGQIDVTTYAKSDTLDRRLDSIQKEMQV